MEPYILFYTFDDHGFVTLKPVYDVISRKFDATILLGANKGYAPFQDCHVKEEIRDGLQGKSFQLGNIYIERKPSVVIGFRMWWPPDYSAAHHARLMGISTVMMNHGSMFVYCTGQTYKKTLYPARMNCVWGPHDFNLWMKWTQEPIIITGNPLHDRFIDYVPEPINVPDEFALLLTSRWQREILNPAAENMNKIIPVVAKCHPLDETKQYYRERYQTYEEPWTLLPLLYRAKYILTNVSSALIPALLWKKPIFIFSFDRPDYFFSEFKASFENKTFNFKNTPDWTDKEFNDPILPTIDDYKHFGHEPDGKNSIRVAAVLEGCLTRL